MTILNTFTIPAPYSQKGLYIYIAKFEYSMLGYSRESIIIGSVKESERQKYFSPYDVILLELDQVIEENKIANGFDKKDFYETTENLTIQISVLGPIFEKDLVELKLNGGSGVHVRIRDVGTDFKKQLIHDLLEVGYDNILNADDGKSTIKEEYWAPYRAMFLEKFPDLKRLEK